MSYNRNSDEVFGKNLTVKSDALRPVEPVVMCELLAEKHHGMKISAPGILRRVGGHLKPGAQEMLKHLNEMASRFYAGDVKAVDEFLQLYCLDDDRPST